MSTPNLTGLAEALGGWANHLPASVRKRIYQSVKVLAGLATLALLVLPYLPRFGVHLPTDVRWDAVLTGLLAFLGHLADTHTSVEPLVDLTPAPESSADVAGPSGMSQPDA